MHPANTKNMYFSKNKPLHTLNNILNEFAGTQIDKANNNVEFICQ